MSRQSATQPAAAAGTLVEMIRTVGLVVKLFFDPKVPLWTKMVPLVTIAYLLWPVDFVPDLFPLLGQFDDLTVLLIGLWAFVQLCPAERVRAHKGQPQTVDATYRVVEDDHDAAAERPLSLSRPDEEKPAPP